MQGPAQPQFLDVRAMMDRSRPRPRVGWVWYVVAGILASWAIGSTKGLPVELQMLSALLTLGLITAAGAGTWLSLKRFRAEQQMLQAIEELIQLRRWQQAAMALQALMSRPMRSNGAWVQSLIYLAGVLARYHRFEDALVVHNFLLDHVELDSPGQYAVRLGRAMAMLREDHLLDADRAIVQLRRMTARQESGGLALVEIYRDVKTGHPAEAIEIFTARLRAMRDQLGHRVADAYALAARAYDMLGKPDDAARAWSDATILTPAGELLRRYPELDRLPARYQPSAAPAGMPA